MRNPYLQDDDALRADLLNLDEDAPAQVPVADPLQVSTPEVETPNVLAPRSQASVAQTATKNNVPDASVLAPQGQTRAERVNQALYAAGTGTVLPDSYFARPSQERQNASKLEMMKQSLLTKYADKERKAQEAMDNSNPDSEASKQARAMVESSPEGKQYAERQGPLWARQSATTLSPLLKTILQNDAKANGEGAKTERTGMQITGKSDLEDKKFGNTTKRDETLHGYKLEENAANNAASKERAEISAGTQKQRFLDRLDREDAQEDHRNVSSLDKDAFSSMQAGATIDRTIDKMGGINKVRGIGPLEGAVPGQAVSPEVDLLRKNYNTLRAVWIHNKYGSALTEPEKKEADKVIPPINGLRTTGEVLDGLDIMRNELNDRLSQATSGWSPKSRERIRMRLMEDHSDDPVFTPQPRIETRKGGVYQKPQAPPSAMPDMSALPDPKPGSVPSVSPGEHPMNTSVPVQEPAPTAQNTKSPQTINVAGKLFDLQPNGKYLPRK